MEIKSMQEAAVRKSVLYRPADTDEVLEQIKLIPRQATNFPFIEITSETTLAAAKWLVVDRQVAQTLCLNFASAKNPGGGFQNGSQAQEESLERASGLYPCIAQMEEMYQYNRSRNTCLYSDYMIYSPKVPLFRDDHDRLLEDPYLVSFVTSPAVNAGVVRERESEKIRLIDRVKCDRIAKIISIAAAYQYRALTIGYGLDRLQWGKVRAIIQEVLGDTEIEVVVCIPPP
ncbi:MAG: TIGR02452 family protein [Clostridia bacterium]